MQRTETVSVGIQNKNTLKTLLLSRLAEKNNAKNRAARIQNRGEKALSASPPAIAASPVAFSWLIPLKADQIGTADMAELQVTVDKTFVPLQISGGASKDPRELGVRVFHAFIQPAG